MYEQLAVAEVDGVAGVWGDSDEFAPPPRSVFSRVLTYRVVKGL